VELIETSQGVDAPTDNRSKIWGFWIRLFEWTGSCVSAWQKFQGPMRPKAGRFDENGDIEE
jgi:hypothetical protein